MTVIFYYLMHETNFFESMFYVPTISHSNHKEIAVIYMQISVISQALIFVIRAHSWSFLERPGIFLFLAFLIAQLTATFIAVYANWEFARIEGCGWRWAMVVWIYNLVCYIPLDIIKLTCHYLLSGRAWDLLTEQRVAFTRSKNYGKDKRQALWAASICSNYVHSNSGELSTALVVPGLTTTSSGRLALQAKRRASIARLAEVHVMKGNTDAIVKLGASSQRYAEDN